MRSLSIITGVVIVALASFAAGLGSAQSGQVLFYNTVDGPRAECVHHVTRRGANCGAMDSLIVEYDNRCTETISVGTCLQQANGRPECGLYGHLPAGGRSSLYTCHSSGGFQIWAGPEGALPPWN